MKNTNLIIRIDDFAIRKIYSYNTRIHDLHNEVLLNSVKCRNLDNLRKCKLKIPKVYKLKPIAGVMYLEAYYHTFVKESFPDH